MYDLYFSDLGRCKTNKWHNVFQNQVCEHRFSSECVPFRDHVCGFGHQEIHYTCDIRGEVYCDLVCWKDCGELIGGSPTGGI